MFVAPAKWYSYFTIAATLSFLAALVDGEGRTVSSALEAWDAERDDREDSGLPRGPCENTVRRWHQELDQEEPGRPWLGRTLAEIAVHVPDEPTASFLAGASGATALFTALTSLGVLLRRCFDAVTGAPALALGLWLVEAKHGQRCLASVELDGRVIPGPSPSFALTQLTAAGYRRARPPP